MNILYEDSSLIVCLKEAGLPVQSADLRRTDLESILKKKLREESGDGPAPYLGIINRLDQPVRGLVLAAKTRKAAARLSEQLADGRMRKTYLALVWEQDGAEAPSEEDRILEDHLIKTKGNLSRLAAKGEAGAKKARLSYRTADEKEGEDACLLFPEYADFIKGRVPGVRTVRIDLMTGRHHQIRVQMAHAHLPVLGDRKYGPDPGSMLPPDAKFPALAAWEMEFLHPENGKTIRVNACVSLYRDFKML